MALKMCPIKNLVSNSDPREKRIIHLTCPFIGYYTTEVFKPKRLGKCLKGSVEHPQ